MKSRIFTTHQHQFYLFQCSGSYVSAQGEPPATPQPPPGGNNGPGGRWW